MSEKNAVRFGIVGLGSMGLDHAKNIIANVKEAKLAAVATTNATIPTVWSPPWRRIPATSSRKPS